MNTDEIRDLNTNTACSTDREMITEALCDLIDNLQSQIDHLHGRRNSEVQAIPDQPDYTPIS